LKLFYFHFIVNDFSHFANLKLFFCRVAAHSRFDLFQTNGTMTPTSTLVSPYGHGINSSVGTLLWTHGYYSDVMLTLGDESDAPVAHLHSIVLGQAQYFALQLAPLIDAAKPSTSSTNPPTCPRAAIIRVPDRPSPLDQWAFWTVLELMYTKDSDLLRQKPLESILAVLSVCLELEWQEGVNLAWSELELLASQAPESEQEILGLVDTLLNVYPHLEQWIHTKKSEINDNDSTKTLFSSPAGGELNNSLKRALSRSHSKLFSTGDDSSCTKNLSQLIFAAAQMYSATAANMTLDGTVSASAAPTRAFTILDSLCKREFHEQRTSPDLITQAFTDTLHEILAILNRSGRARDLSQVVSAGRALVYVLKRIAEYVPLPAQSLYIYPFFDAMEELISISEIENSYLPTIFADAVPYILELTFPAQEKVPVLPFHEVTEVACRLLKLAFHWSPPRLARPNGPWDMFFARLLTSSCASIADRRKVIAALIPSSQKMSIRTSRLRNGTAPPVPRRIRPNRHIHVRARLSVVTPEINRCAEIEENHSFMPISTSGSPHGEPCMEGRTTNLHTHEVKENIQTDFTNSPKKDADSEDKGLIGTATRDAIKLAMAHPESSKRKKKQNLIPSLHIWSSKLFASSKSFS
jgi:hypothetical protein